MFPHDLIQATHFWQGCRRNKAVFLLHPAKGTEYWFVSLLVTLSSLIGFKWIPLGFPITNWNPALWNAEELFETV